MTTIPGYRETVDASIVFNPLLFIAAPSDRGVYMGPRIFGGEPHKYDCWDWMEDGASDSTVEVWLGNKNRGKSAANKSHCRRIRLRRADITGRVPRVSAFDLKPLNKKDEQKRDEETGRLILDPAASSKKKRRAGEYRPLALMYGCQPITPATRAYNFMHPDFELTFSENLRQLEFAIEQTVGLPLTFDQMEALKVAVWIIRQKKYSLRPSFSHAMVAARRMTDADIRGYSFSIDEHLLDEVIADPYYDEKLITGFKATLAQPQNIDFDRVRKGAVEVSGMLRTVLEKFPWLGGVDSAYGDLSQDFVVHDCDGMSDEEIAVYQSQLRIIASSASRRGDEDLRVDVEIHEENSTSWNQLTYARDMFPHIKQVRKDARNIKLITQFPRDYETAGGEGSETSRKALAMLSNVDNFFASRMPEAEVNWMHDNVFKMSDFERQMYQELGVGDFGHKPMPNHDVIFFHYRLQPSDWSVIESNTALFERQG